MSKKIEILLLKPLPPKGNAGDVIEVKTHFALHVLIPQGTAVVYDKQTKNQRESQMKKVAANKAELQKHVVDMVAAVEKAGGLHFVKAATEAGTLYDSINHKSIAQYIADTYKVRLGADAYRLEAKIEELGEYTVAFAHEDITATFPIHVVAETKKVAVTA